MTAPIQMPPGAPVIAGDAPEAKANKDGDGYITRRIEARVTQPGITLFNGAEQSEVFITSKTTGERVSFGRKLGVRAFEGVEMLLTNDHQNGVFWILVIDSATEMMFQNGYLAQNAEDAFQIFVGGSPEEVRATLMTDEPAAN